MSNAIVGAKEGWNDGKKLFGSAIAPGTILGAKSGWNDGKKLFDSAISPGTILWDEHRVFADQLWASDAISAATKHRITPDGTFILPVSPDNLVNGIRLYSSKKDEDVGSSEYSLQSYDSRKTYTVDIPKTKLVIGTKIPVFTNIPMIEFYDITKINNLYMTLTSETKFEFVSGATKSTQIASGSNDIRLWRYLISIDKIEAY